MKTRRKRGNISLAVAVLCISTAGMLIGLHPNSASAQSTPKLEDSVVFSMPGGPPSEVMQKCADDDFTKQFHVRLDIQQMQSEPALAKALLQRNNPSIDVMWGVAQTNHTGFKEGVLTSIPSSQIPNLANVDPKFPPEPDQRVLMSTALQGIVYNTEVFKQKGWDPPTSWRDLWDPKYKGHVGITALNVVSGQSILAAASFLNGGSATNFDAGFEYLAKLKPNLYTIFSQAPQYEAALADGTVWIGVAPNNRALAMKQQGAPLAFVQPSEGNILVNLYLSVVKGAPHPNAALAFVNWMLSTKAQSCMMSAGSVPVVKGVDVSADLAPFMTIEREAIPLDWVDLQEKLPELLKRWNKDIAG